MGVEACTRITRHTGHRNSFHRKRPLGLGRNARGPVTGLLSASVREGCGALDQEHREQSAARWFQDMKASGKNLHASTAVPALSSFLHGHLSVAHAVITVYPWPFYFLMAFAPRADLTKRLLTGAKSLVPLAVLYGILLLASWTPDTLSTLLPGDFAEGMKSALQGRPKMQFLPEIQAVGKLLSAPIASVSAWAHLQFIAFFCARWIWMDGLMRGVNTVHSVLLCAVLPPLGFLAHIVTTFLKRQFGSGGTPAPSAASPAAGSTAGSAAGSAAGGNGAAPPKAQPVATPATSSAQPSSVQPSSNADAWAAATAGVGIVGSHPRTADDDGADAAAPAPEASRSAAAGPTDEVAEVATADPAVGSRPGGRSRGPPDLELESGNGASAQSSESTERPTAAASAEVAVASESTESPKAAASAEVAVASDSPESPKPASAEAAIEEGGNGAGANSAEPSEPSARTDNGDRSWLTILEPKYVKRG